MKKEIRQLHGTLLDLVAFMNRPQHDVALIQEAGVQLDRALFPLLMVIERHDGIGVNDLAETVGRDYTTVSRQVAKLESLGMVARRASKADKRVNEAVIINKGRRMIESLNAARERMASVVLAGWSTEELQQLARLMRKFANDLQGWRNT